MKKLKLLFMTACALVGVCQSTWADTSLLTTEKGWSKITSISLGDIANNYYVFVANDADLMLGIANSVTQSNNALFYQPSVDPATDLTKVFYLEANGENYAMRNVKIDYLQFQTEWSGSSVDLRWRNNDQPVSIDWTRLGLAYSDGAWSLTSTKYNRPLGIYNNTTGTPVTGNEIGANNAGNGQKFQIYAIARQQFAKLVGAGATESSPKDLSGLIFNSDFENTAKTKDYGWTVSTKTGGNYNFNGAVEAWHYGVFDLHQTLKVPNGVYRVTVQAVSSTSAYVYAGDTKTYVTQAASGDFAAEKNSMAANANYGLIAAETTITNGQITFGIADPNNASAWLVFDNFKLYYLGVDLDILEDSYNNALAAAKAVDQDAPMQASILTALQEAISTYSSVARDEEALETATTALQTATDNATASITAYANAKAYLDRMEGYLTGANTFTNFYTTSAYNTYYKDIKDAYDARTMTTEVGNPLSAELAYQSGTTWHKVNNLDNIMLSTWKVGETQCNEFDASLYVNTWSIEGNTDGSEFYAPFYEYWVSSTNVLAANTFTSTITGLKASTTYSVTIRARVQPTDDRSKVTDAITMKVGEGEAVCISDGAKFGATNFYIGNFSAVGTTDAEGNLVTTITVADASNVSWLSFYNVRYTEGEDLSAYIADYEFAQANAIAAQSKPMDPTKRTALDTAVSTYGSLNTAEATKSELIEAKEALEAALADASPSIAALECSNVSLWTTTTNNGTFEVNTWSNEGNTDGSGMTTPFIQNWIHQNSGILNDVTMSYQLTGQTPGYYRVTALVRSLYEKGGALPAGTFLFANDAIERAYNGTTCTNGVYKTPEVYGYVGDDGKLTIGIKVIKATVNWVAFKNFTIEYVGTTLTSEIAQNLTEEARVFENVTSSTAATNQQNAITALETLSDANYVAAGQAIETAYKAIDRDFSALQAAITAKESAVLGFEAGEYAPYNLVAPLAAAQAIDQESETSTQSEINTAATNLNAVAANDGEVNAFYKGDFDGYAEDTTTPLDYTPNGWTATDNFRVMLKNAETYPGLNDASAGTATMSWSGGITYGETAGYTMPLKANTVYRLQFKAAGWNNETRSGISVSILNSTDGMALYNLGTPDRDIQGNATNAAGMTSYNIVFATGAAGNYVFHIQSGNNFVVTDFSITKAASQVLEFADGSVPTYAPGTYPSVKITRSLTANKWATAVYPFAVSGVDNIAVLDSYNSTTGELSFNSAVASTANEPFFMMSKTDKSEITLSNVAVAAASASPVTESEASLIGAYAVTNITNAEKNYVLSNNQIFSVGDAGATINPYRAYIQLAEGGSGSARALRFVVDGQITGVDNIAADTEATLKDGKYLENGKIVIVKNGVKYNAAGQQVK